MTINCYLWQKQIRLIIIVSLASLESQQVSHFVDNATILKETRATLKEDINKIDEKTPGVFWLPFIHKRDKDSRKLLEIILDFYLFVISIESSYQSDATDSTNLLLISFSKDLFNFSWEVP